MIKFVLHGGDLGDKNRDNYGFFKEMTTGNSRNLNLLMTYFANDENKVEDKFKRHGDAFRYFAKDKSTDIKLAEVNKFPEQVKWADVIYLAGGVATEELVNKLSLIKNLEKLFDGKVVGGSSAGANCLSKYYYGNESQKIGNGLGILNIKTFCHFKQKDTKFVEKLASYKEKLPLLVLPSYKWVVIFK